VTALGALNLQNHLICQILSYGYSGMVAGATKSLHHDFRPCLFPQNQTAVWMEVDPQKVMQ
jgi:hypothetical protein